MMSEFLAQIAEHNGYSETNTWRKTVYERLQSDVDSLSPNEISERLNELGWVLPPDDLVPTPEMVELLVRSASNPDNPPNKDDK